MAAYKADVNIGTSVLDAAILERLSALGLEPLELRRLKFDLIQY